MSSTSFGEYLNAGTTCIKFGQNGRNPRPAGLYPMGFMLIFGQSALTSLPLMGPVELVLDLVEALPFLGFNIPGILPGESYISLCALAE